ncbi:tRNA (adenosine(37)-N6)-threonylcarbamoyltransferase complex dimerization subunit type 1 TsaB [Desulfatibacillum aliphaticivorans]|uniref:tRNA (adenosine(37)-N6)-threonylcarbamoyltransferase complex dimerization subunit type 1 TsaB n=1 Tax=Desulfatibacillum aliphaticivorans TaxID=218208 RepID=UPI00040E224D|nr:tRNA (adenosine(37)-N6)-threonylcarbamoyltransferase complex dimerization subunit type 1 TsaB [Desulfatibacillum aliphaticivorans]
MIVLAMDTAALGFGVVVVEDGRVLAREQGERSRSHARSLMDAVQNVLNEAGLKPAQVDGLAVTCGPGSFTGLRIGIASAKGLASALNIPVYGVSTLYALAKAAQPCNLPVQAAMDARKGQVYAAEFRPSDNGLVQTSPEAAKSPEQWICEVSEQSLFIGDGAALYREFIEAELGGKARFAPEDLNRIDITVVADIAAKAIKEGKACSAADLKATYIRKSDAKLPKIPQAV